MKKCTLPFQALVDFHDNVAHESVASQVREHLAAGCERCTAELAQIGKMLSTMSAAEAVHAPEAARRQAYNIFRERFTQPARRSLLARLIFDERQNLAFAGARGEQAASIQTLYATDEHDIDLWQEKTHGGAWYMIGQVLPKQGGDPIVPVEAVLVASEGREVAASMEPGEFHLEEVPAGRYSLRLTLQDTDVTVPDVVVGR